MTLSEPGGTDRKRFSIVSAVYDVARYLPDFIASIEAQTFDLASVEVLVVDDGSQDESLRLLQEWAGRRPGLVTVLSKPNGGQASARNLGLDHVTGEWVTFIDPDDMVAPDYLDRVAWALDHDPSVVMVATNRLIYVDETGEVVERHPLRAMFAHRDQFKDLNRFPDFFHGSAPAAFLRTDLIEKHDLRFDERIRPNFEDGHLCQRYLLRCDVPQVAFLRTAHYHYRKRLDESSTLQTGSTKPSRYTDVPRHGYLELLREGAELYGGRAPEWLQNMIVYELSHYISPEDATWSTATACTGAVAEEFIGLLRLIRRELDDHVIRSFDVRRLRPEWRQLLLHGLSDEPWHTPYVVTHRYDERHQQVLVSFRWTGPEPEVSVRLRGRTVQPVASKRRVLEYWGHPLLRERLMWVSAKGTLRVALDGRFVELRTSWAEFTPTSVRPAALRRRFELREPDPVEEPKTSPGLSVEAVRRLAATPPVRRLFADAWVLMDRVDDAADSGELLFRYLRSEHRGINAWFVVMPDSPDFARLKKDGYRRVVAYGSLTWKLLMLSCRTLVSSHIDDGIVRPPLLADLVPEPTWTFTFLQHGVIKDDLSGWLNRKKIDLFITSTPAEHESIAGDDNRYVYTAKEVRRTGLPRFDRLRALAATTGPDEQRTILVAPTWRDWLSAPLEVGRYRREVSHTFPGSEYAESWLGLLRSDTLRRVCREQGLQVGFLPHPNMQPILDTIELPDHVVPLRYEDNDVQALFARAALLVTDYSSVAFNAAYVERPVVYFQFDAERVRMGAHRGRAGYFDYERDGFGPVTYTLADAEAAVEATTGAGRRTGEPYRSRIEVAFPDRDGQCCARVVRAIRSL